MFGSQRTLESYQINIKNERKKIDELVVKDGTSNADELARKRKEKYVLRYWDKEYSNKLSNVQYKTLKKQLGNILTYGLQASSPNQMKIML